MRSHWRLLIAVVLLWSTRTLAQDPVLEGEWSWGAGGGVTRILADGTGRDARGNTMQWTVGDASARVYVLRWSHGYTDTVTLSADGGSLSGSNQQGYRFSAKRIGAAPAPAPSSPPAGDSVIAGEWNWGVGGGIVEIRPDGTGRDARGNSMRWTLRDPASRSYEFRWSHGYTDTATLAVDGNSLMAVNDKGTRFSATRRTGATGRPLDLNGSWARGQVHVWQEGSEVLVTATWKRDDGKYVVWRGEGRLSGSVVDLRIRYSPMTHGPVPEWRGRMTVSADGNTIDAVYSVNGEQRDTRTYSRDR